MSFYRKYLTIDGLTGNTYRYENHHPGEVFEQVRHTLHLDKSEGRDCHYLALINGATPNNYTHRDLLYAGNQVSPCRMFRGDGLKGNNFHHKEMRTAGLVDVLKSGKTVTIYIKRCTAKAA